MCELFAMSSRYLTDARASLQAFARHGGPDGPHKDGWGIAYYADEDVRLVKDAEPAFDSACVRFMEQHPFTSGVVLSHIRRGTQGRMAMKNCQPFTRELGGRMHVFAHNGDLDMASLRAGMSLRQFHPVGETDSEYAFCAMLEWLRPLWLRGGLPALAARFAIVARFAAALRSLGPANFVYADGDTLFLHGHKRSQGDGAPPRPPGLHVLHRHCDPAQNVILAASVPLTDEPGWRALAEGELIVAQRGSVLDYLEERSRLFCSYSSRPISPRA